MTGSAAVEHSHAGSGGLRPPAFDGRRASGDGRESSRSLRKGEAV